MGSKTHPKGFRLAANKDNWDANWYADIRSNDGNNTIRQFVKEDTIVRDYIEKRHEYLISRINIKRIVNQLTIDIHSSRPGSIIGKSGKGIEKIKEDLNKIIQNREISINIFEIKNADCNARNVGNQIAKKLKGHAQFKRVIKTALDSAMRQGAKGIKVICSGRLNGAEIARSVKYQKGAVPLHTLRANIDYAMVTAKTAYGILGIKVYIYV